MLESKAKIRKQKKERRHERIRARVFGTAKRPRLSVFRSNKHIFAQLIDDEKQITLASVSDQHLTKAKKNESGLDRAFSAGKLLAEKAKSQGIKTVVFDRGGYLYHGQIKKLAEGAREGGLAF
ncbi:MAG: 50S ribosomal protein L18 [Patescibacteria group bacterium]